MIYIVFSIVILFLIIVNFIIGYIWGKKPDVEVATRVLSVILVIFAVLNAYASHRASVRKSAASQNKSVITAPTVE